MFKRVVFYLSFLVSLNGLSQRVNYSDEYLDSIIGTALQQKKDYKNKSLADISAYLKVEGNQELQYAVIAKWVVNHLNYDIKKRSQPLKSVLNRKNGVCWHYSKVTDSLAQYLGLKSYYISGYVKEIKNNRLKYERHAWNAVEIDGKILMADITWSDGDNVKRSTNAPLEKTYFLMQPEKFIVSHFPDKKKFRFTKYSAHKFKTSPVVYPKYHELDKDFPINLHGIKQYTKKRDLKISFKTSNSDADIQKIHLEKWDNDKDISSYEFDKKFDPKKQEIVYSLNTSNITFKKHQRVSISVEYKENNIDGNIITYSWVIIDFFWK